MLFSGMTVVAVLLIAPCASAAPQQQQPESQEQRQDTGADRVAEREERPAAVPTPSVTDTVTEGVAVPWDVAFLPGGSALVTERDSAMVQRVTPAGEVTEVAAIEDAVPGGEGGLLGITVSPDFEQNGHVFLYYTAAQDNRIVRMTYAEGNLTNPEPLVTGIEKGMIHNGGRIEFGPDGMLYIGTGEAGNTDLSQDPNSLNGKILRVTPDGEPAPGNPNGDLIWSLGHRNVQGLAWDDEGNMWASELGQNTFDELNRIEPGSNYGWPICEGTCDDDGFVNPELTWPTSEASPSPLAFADGALWMGALRGERLWGIEIAGGEVVGEPEAFFTGEHGRWRAITPGGEGTFWVATNSPDRILELTLGE